MEDTQPTSFFPAWLQQLLSLSLTIAAVVVYAAVLGVAIVRTLLEGDPQFSEVAVRAAQLASGLVGAVVTAGFARSKRPAATPVSADHPMGGRAPTAWTSLRPPSRTRSKLVGLGETLGLCSGAAQVTPPATRDNEPPPVTPQPQPQPQPQGAPAALWIGLAYFVVYFLVGVASFALILLRPAVPELIANAAWVWLGTVMSAGYSFFALGG